MSTAEAVLRQVVCALPAIDLEALNARAELLTRTDRKYVVNHEQLGQLMGEIAGSVDVLEIEGRRLSAYSSVYYDTEDLWTYRAHLQQRRRRYKVRLRSYLDTGGQFVEVKYKGHRQATYKVRTEHDLLLRAGGGLGREGEDFAASVLGRVYGVGLPGTLSASATTTNQRSTLLLRHQDARLTVDVDLRFAHAGAAGGLRERYAVVETKSASGVTLGDRALRRLGVRPVSVSKYCAAIAVLRPEVTSSPWRRLVRTYFEAHPSTDGAALEAPVLSQVS